MKILFGKSNWEMSARPVEEFLERAKADGFDAVEIFLDYRWESAKEIRAAVGSSGMWLIAQTISVGKTADEHLGSLKWQIDLAHECGAVFINSHAGSDVFSFEENVGIIEEAIDHAAKRGLKIVFETHRGRPTFSGPTTCKLLEAVPRMRVNADFSHWFCVHESDLSDQPRNVQLAIERADYIHARVGFEQGPQVPDPTAPEWQATVEKFFALWHRILDARSAEGREWFVVTPEFGPPPYMPLEPFTARPLADTWDVNRRFFAVLRERLVS
jgi:sugar phosphate isomerase/epimerase